MSRVSLSNSERGSRLYGNTSAQFELNPLTVADAGTELTKACHGNALASGWHTAENGARKIHNRAERLMLIVSEAAEAMEGVRKGLMDDHLPDVPMHAAELADIAIRVFDEAGDCGYDLGTIIARKLAYNAQRADHRPENRALAGGKTF